MEELVELEELGLFLLALEVAHQAPLPTAAGAEHQP